MLLKLHGVLPILLPFCSCAFRSKHVPQSPLQPEPPSLADEANQLGTEYARYGLRRDTGAPVSFLEAFDAYQGTKIKGSYFDKKWLGLRYNAVKRDFVVDPAITPSVLREITGKVCPISLVRFDIGRVSPANPSVDRLINAGTYALGNLAVFTQRVNRAKGDKTFEQIVELAQGQRAAEGLEWMEWARLAALMYGAWDAMQGAEDRWLVPMAVMPQRHLFTPTSQLVQHLLMRQCRKGGPGLNYWRAITVQATGQSAALDSLEAQLRSALAQESYAPNAWLRLEVFEPFVAWYGACREAVALAFDVYRVRFQSETDVDSLIGRWALGS